VRGYQDVQRRHGRSGVGNEERTCYVGDARSGVTLHKAAALRTATAYTATAYTATAYTATAYTATAYTITAWTVTAHTERFDVLFSCRRDRSGNPEISKEKETPYHPSYTYLPDSDHPR
jgi:hypothetical protein